MTASEAKKAFIERRPVAIRHASNGIVSYDRISAIYYRMDDAGKIYVCVECLDKNGVCVDGAPVEDVFPIEDIGGEKWKRG